MKKINEGIIEFETLMSKVRSASTTNQKDKLEADLKRDIKKLQRLREQVKGWISGTEVKDKAPLQDARKRIETQMEAFKAYEREAKTKAFSKEGLQRQREKEMRGEEGGRDISEWLQDRIEELKRQIEVLEGEMESEVVGKKSKKPTSSENTAHRLERHNFHLDGLEKLLRMWENEAIERDSVEGVKDDIDYYVDNNQDDDFMENETIYDDLGLDEWDPAEGLDHEYGDYDPGEDELDPDDQLSGDDSSTRHSFDGDEDDASDHTSSTAPSLSSNASAAPNSSSHITSPAENGSKHLTSHATASATSNVAPGASRSSAPSAATTSTGENNATDAHSLKRAQEATSGARAAANTVAAPSVVLPALSMLDPTPAEAARGIRSSSHHTPVEPVHVTPVLASSTGVPASANPLALSSSNVGPHSNATSGSVAVGSTASSANSTLTGSVGTGSVGSSLSMLGATAAPGGSGAMPASMATASITSTPLSTTGQLPMVSGSLTASGTINMGLGLSTSLTSSGTLASSSQMIGGNVASGLSQSDAISTLGTSSGIAHAASGVNVAPGAVNPAMAASGTAAGGLAGVASITPATIGIPRFTPSTQRPESEMMEMAGLKASARYLPEPEPTRPPYKPRTPSSTPSSYPSVPAQNLLDDPSTFQKFPPDLLFFLFYFQQNTYQQYLAARELKRQSWRYHTKYLTWFQRHEDPKTISESFEQGTYVYFDYETGWCQRKKSEFTFQYIFLEDNELP